MLAQRPSWPVDELAEALGCPPLGLAPVLWPLIDSRQVLRAGLGRFSISADFLVEVALEQFPEGATSAQIMARARQITGRDCLNQSQAGRALRRLRKAGRATRQGRAYFLAPFAPSSAAEPSPPAAAPEPKGAPTSRRSRPDWRAHLDGPADLRTTLAVWMERAGLDDTTKARLWADLEGAPT